MGKSVAEIHQWLYNKILLAERNEEDIKEWASHKGLAVDDWMHEINERYGQPSGGRPLKEVIKSGNIHITLYEWVNGTELRLAALVTKILAINPQYKDDLINLFKSKGVIVAREYQGVQPQTPEEIYIILNDFLLDGMPTDRVNEVLSGNENVIIWRMIACLHKPHWDEVNGDVEHYYDLREAWVKAFVETLAPDFTYERRPGGNQKIVRIIAG